MTDWNFRKSGERIVYDAKTFFFGLIQKKKYIAINLIIMLVNMNILVNPEKLLILHLRIL